MIVKIKGGWRQFAAFFLKYQEELKLFLHMKKSGIVCKRCYQLSNAGGTEDWSVGAEVSKISLPDEEHHLLVTQRNKQAPFSHCSLEDSF